MRGRISIKPLRRLHHSGATAKATVDIQSEADCIAGEIAEVSTSILQFQSLIEQMQSIEDTLTKAIEGETAVTID